MSSCAVNRSKVYQRSRSIVRTKPQLNVIQSEIQVLTKAIVSTGDDDDDNENGDDN
jgi:hypothetical protein